MLATWAVTRRRTCSGRRRRVCGALELVERAADLGDHGVPGDEAEAGVRGVDGVRAGQGAEVGGGGSHVWAPRGQFG